MARAVLGARGRYVAHAPEPVGETSMLFHRLRGQAGADGCVFVGVDFPIGLPIAYANAAGIDDFVETLPSLGSGVWSQFYEVAERAAEIGPGRPFYPYRPGGTSQRHLLAAHAVARVDDLRRRCELAGNGRRAACPLFWTLGGNQVGKGAIAGWRDLIAPALRDPSIDLAIWPFDGSLPELFQPGRIVLAETYPGEVYAHLGVDLTRGRSYGRHGKRWQPSRIANASALLGGLEAAQADATQELYRAIETGFGLSEAEEDPFDAVVGLCGMLAVALGLRPNGPPADDAVRRIEGWILGMRADLLPNRPGSA